MGADSLAERACRAIRQHFCGRDSQLEGGLGHGGKIPQLSPPEVVAVKATISFVYLVSLVVNAFPTDGKGKPLTTKGTKVYEGSHFAGLDFGAWDCMFRTIPSPSFTKIN